jgi:hypothetical protein
MVALVRLETAMCPAWDTPPRPCQWPHPPRLRREVLTPREWRKWSGR